MDAGDTLELGIRCGGGRIVVVLVVLFNFRLTGCCVTTALITGRPSTRRTGVVVVVEMNFFCC